MVRIHVAFLLGKNKQCLTLQMGQGTICRWEVVTLRLDLDGLPFFCRRKNVRLPFHFTVDSSQLLIRLSLLSVVLWLKR